jgi:signal transduction histidine kinase
LLAQLATAFEGSKRFTADAAHELRTPLAGIAAQTEVALLTTDESVRGGALAAIKTATKKMTRLVHQLLTLARWDTNVANFQRAPLMLNIVAAEVTRELEDAATARNIRLSCEVISEPLMFGDETTVQMIARNIIDNAVRYTNPGGTVRVEVDSTPEHAVLRVIDTGPGLSAEERDRIFQRFYRGGRHDMTGSGLGLSIVRQCVDLHGGTIDLESPETGGLIVIVHLPKRAAHGARDTLIVGETKRSDIA